jgi:hypothetical protein
MGVLLNERSEGSERRAYGNLDTFITHRTWDGLQAEKLMVAEPP